jgi:group I intron endonuclease
MKANKNHKRCGIYCIKNTINNKVYIGKSIDIYRRIKEHINMLNLKRKDENAHLTNAWHKYGADSFEYSVLEYLEADEKNVAIRELHWMKQFNALNKEYGYNLRSDSDSKMIVHLDTSTKISNRLKAEWKAGIRDGHSAKLKSSWKQDTNRKTAQSALLSKTLFSPTQTQRRLRCAESYCKPAISTPFSTFHQAHFRVLVCAQWSCFLKRVNPPRKCGITNSTPDEKWARTRHSTTPTLKTLSRYRKQRKTRQTHGPPILLRLTPAPTTSPYATRMLSDPLN